MARRLHTSSPEETSQGEDLNELLPGSPSQAVAHHFSTEIKAVSNPEDAPQVALSTAAKLSTRAASPEPAEHRAAASDSDETERAARLRPASAIQSIWAAHVASNGQNAPRTVSETPSTPGAATNAASASCSGSPQRRRAPAVSPSPLSRPS